MNRSLFNTKNTSRVFVMIFYVLIAVFFIIYINNTDFSKIDLTSIDWALLLAAVLLGVVARYWSAFIWILVLRSLGAKDLIANIKELFYVYAKSWMGRYIAGKLPWIAGKIYFASKLGISKNKLAIGSLVEIALQILTYTIVPLTLILFDSNLAGISLPYMPALILTTILCILCITPAVFNRLISLTYKITKRLEFDEYDKISGKIIISGMLMYIVIALVNGVTLYLIAIAVDSKITPEQIPYVMATSNLASALGIIALFAPSGLGVRDGAQLILLSAITKPELAIAITVLSRVSELICDPLFFSLTKMCKSNSGFLRHHKSIG